MNFHAQVQVVVHLYDVLNVCKVLQDFFLTFANVGEEVEAGEFYRCCRFPSQPQYACAGFAP